MNQKIISFSIFTALAFGAPACSSHSHKTTVETSTMSDDGVAHDIGAEQEVTRTTTTEEEHHDEQEGGILSGTVEIIGDILALPFRAVAGLFRLIF